jgi:hypothetical protein
VNINNVTPTLSLLRVLIWIPLLFIPESIAAISIGKPQFTEGNVDLNLPSGLYEKYAHAGLDMEKSGTCIVAVCKNADTIAVSSMIAEVDANNLMDGTLHERPRNTF